MKFSVLTDFVSSIRRQPADATEQGTEMRNAEEGRGRKKGKEKYDLQQARDQDMAAFMRTMTISMLTFKEGKDDLKRAAVSRYTHLKLVGGVMLAIAESTGAFVLSFAANIHASPTGPLSLPDKPGTTTVVVLAVLGGVLLAIRPFCQAVERIAYLIIRHVRPGLICRLEQSQPQNETLSIRELKLAEGWVELHRELCEAVVRMELNLIFANLLVADQLTAGLTAAITVTSTIASSIVCRIAVTRLKACASAYELAFAGKADPDKKSKKLEEEMKTLRILELPALLCALSIPGVGIGVSLVRQHRRLGDQFADYIQVNMIAAVINFVLLAGGLIMLVEATMKLAKLKTIIEGRYLDSNETYRDYLGNYVKHEGISDAEIDGLMAAFEERTRLVEQREQEIQDLHTMEDEALKKIYQATVEDDLGADDERHNFKKVPSIMSIHHRMMYLTDRPPADQDVSAKASTSGSSSGQCDRRPSKLPEKSSFWEYLRVAPRGRAKSTT